jgi:hypothetical protein
MELRTTPQTGSVNVNRQAGAIRLNAVKALAAQISSRVTQAPGNTRIEVAEASYSTLLLTMHTMLGSDQETLKGWQQVAWLVSNLNIRLLIDMLADNRVAELQVRVATLLDIPDLPPISSLADIHEAIHAAIRVGAPRYNSGDQRGCCTVYWATIQTLLATTPVRGFPGFARALGQLRPIAELEVQLMSLGPEQTDELAWEMRHALDAALEING